MVVWASVRDRSGNIKLRPLLITSIHPTDKKAPVVAHCISTRKENDDSDPIVEMPWDARTGAGVGLYCWCALVLRWSVIVDQSNIQECTGQVTKEFLARVMDQLARFI